MHSHSPAKSKVIVEENCKNILGSYTLHFDKFKSYSNLGFWNLREYDTLKINMIENAIRFSGVYGGTVKAAVEIPKEKYQCKDGILTVNIDNQFINDGGVSVYEARSINFYSYVSSEVFAQYTQASTGLVFMVPASFSEDSLIELRKIK